MADGGAKPHEGNRWNWPGAVAVVLGLALLIVLLIWRVATGGDDPGAVRCGSQPTRDSTITPLPDPSEIATIWCRQSGRPEFPILFVPDQLIVEPADSTADPVLIRQYVAGKLAACNGGENVEITDVKPPDVPAEPSDPEVVEGDTLESPTVAAPAAAPPNNVDGAPAPKTLVYRIQNFIAGADAKAESVEFALCVGRQLRERGEPFAFIGGAKVFIDLNYVHSLNPAWSFKPAYDPSGTVAQLPTSPPAPTKSTIPKLALPSSVARTQGAPSIVVIDTGYPLDKKTNTLVKPSWVTNDGGPEPAYGTTKGIVTQPLSEQIARHGPFIVSQIGAAVAGRSVGQVVLGRLVSTLTLPYFAESDLLDTLKRVFGYGGSSYRFGAVAGATAAKGASVVSMSFGSTATSGPPFEHTPLAEVFAKLVASNGWVNSPAQLPVVAAAAGNDGLEDNTRLPAAYAGAGSLDKVAAVLGLTSKAGLDKYVLSVGAAQPVGTTSSTGTSVAATNVARTQAQRRDYSNIVASSSMTWMPGDCWGVVPEWNGSSWANNRSQWWGGTSIATANAAAAAFLTWPGLSGGRNKIDLDPLERTKLVPAGKAEDTCF